MRWCHQVEVAILFKNNTRKQDIVCFDGIEPLEDNKELEENWGNEDAKWTTVVLYNNLLFFFFVALFIP